MRSPQVLVVLVGALVAAPVVSPGAPARASPAATVSACMDPGRFAGSLGRVAFVRAGRLEVADLADCRLVTLVSAGAEPPVRWSADARFVGFGDGAVVSAAGGRVEYPLGRLARGLGSGSASWAWSPSGHRLAGVTAGGGVLTGGPGLVARTLIPVGWGATSIAFAPSGGSVAISRSPERRGVAPGPEQVWVASLATGARRAIYRVPSGRVAPPWLFGYSPDGRWLIAWQDLDDSASLAADGLPLIAIPVGGGAPRTLGSSLVYDDFLSWCGERLAHPSDRDGREVTLGGRIELAGPPPGWRETDSGLLPAGARLSFVSPACPQDGATVIAAAAGPETADDPVGQERRRIWLLQGLGGRWRPLEPAPPPGSSDELPTWIGSGRVIAFVRTAWSGRAGVATGRLYLLALGGPGRWRLVGPLASVGTTANYDGHYGWGDQLAWTGG